MKHFLFLDLVLVGYLSPLFFIKLGLGLGFLAESYLAGTYGLSVTTFF